MEGRIDAFVGGIGTGGTVSGVGRFLKERDPAIQVVAVDVEGSVFSRHFAALSGVPDASAPEGRYLLEGLGDEEIIDCPEFDVFDRMLQVSDAEAFLAARELARREAMLVGGSERRGALGRPADAGGAAAGRSGSNAVPRFGDPLPEHDLQRRLAA